jgi:hypothetical protein
MRLHDWPTIEKELNAKLVIDRANLENNELDVLATAKVRGRIEVLKELLRLPQKLEAEQWKDDPVE